MQRVGGWFQSRGARGTSLSQRIDSSQELADFQNAMKYAGYIMNDDVEGAEEGLSNGDSSFHKLGRAVVGFFKAALGFERAVMREASDRLSEAESSASSDLSRAQRSNDVYQSSIYTKGSEFALCAAEAQIMTAVVGILNESLTEAIKGFYKVRKAFITLESLYNQEIKYAASNPSFNGQGTAGLMVNKPAASLPGTPIKSSEPVEQPANSTGISEKEEEEEDAEFSDANEEKLSPTPLEYQGHLYFENEEKVLADISISDQPLPQPTPAQSISLPPPYSTLDLNAELSPLDAFIQSGVSLFYGFLLLMISNIPPAFSKLISIIGFHGDKEKGLRLLWQASRSETAHGAMAALVLLGWYNGLVGYCDIVPEPSAGSTPSTQIEGYPIQRLRSLISTMSSRYPKSQLWLLERARMYGSRRNLHKSLQLLQQPSTPSSLKQITAFQMFERGMSAMWAHEYSLSASSFLTCADLNTWSKALYYYNAGACHLALYRALKTSNPKAAATHAEEAETHFRTAPTHVGRKRILARPIPLDVFVARKIEKWDQRSRLLNIPFIDAIGISPAEEICYLWNGYRKKNRQQLKQSLDILSSSSTTSTTTAPTEAADPADPIIRTLLTAAIHRHLRNHDEALSLLQTQILCPPSSPPQHNGPNPTTNNNLRSTFRGDPSQDWILPVAHYEVAVNYWMQRSQYRRRYGDQLIEFTTDDDNEVAGTDSAAGAGGPEKARTTTTMMPADDEEEKDADRALVKQCKEHIMAVKNWPESFTLESRIGLKISSAVDAIAKWEETYGVVVVEEGGGVVVV